MLTQEQIFQLEGCRSFSQYCQLMESFEPGFDEQASCIFCSPEKHGNIIDWEDPNGLASEVRISAAAWSMKALAFISFV